jgi:hypothetical protein
MALRDSGAVPAGRVIDVQFADFMKDPWTTISGIYQKLGRELRSDTEQKMRDFLAAHPSDGGHGRYTWSDTGLNAGEVRDRVRAYQDRYSVPTEQLR